MNFTADFLSKSIANTLEAEECYEVSGRLLIGQFGAIVHKFLSFFYDNDKESIPKDTLLGEWV